MCIHVNQIILYVPPALLKSLLLFDLKQHFLLKSIDNFLPLVTEQLLIQLEEHCCLYTDSKQMSAQHLIGIGEPILTLQTLVNFSLEY